MKAFHNDPKIKAKYVKRVLAHQRADEIVKGYYWEEGKGCAVGCTIHGSTHQNYETELGIPEWLARLEDTLFEHMARKDAKLWPAQFLKAIKPGVNLEKCKIPILIAIVEVARTTTKDSHALAAIDNVLKELKKSILNKKALKAAGIASASSAAHAATATASYAASSASYAASYASSYASYAASCAASYAAAYASSAARSYAAPAAYAASYAASFKIATAVLKILKGAK